MGSDEHRRKRTLVIGIVFGSVYLISGILQFLTSISIIDDPIGNLPGDVIGGSVMIIISMIFIAGVLSYKKEEGKMRSYILVGTFLSIFYGITQVLVTISEYISHLIGATGAEEDIIINLLAPSIILCILLIPIGVSMILFKARGENR